MDKIAKVISHKSPEIQELEDAVLETETELAELKKQLTQLRNKVVMKHWPKGYKKPAFDPKGHLMPNACPLNWQWADGAIIFFENPRYESDDEDEDEDT